MPIPNVQTGFFRAGWSLALALLVLLPDSSVLAQGNAPGQDDIVEVSPEDLLRQPQAHWAVPVVFRDKLVSLPGGRSIKINNETYLRFSTAFIEDCYVGSRLAPRLEVQELNKDYLFIATVLQRGGRWRKKYYITVNDLQPATMKPEELPAASSDIDDMNDTDADPGFQRIQDIANAAEQALFVYRKENELEGLSILGPDAKQRKEVESIIRRVIDGEERENATTARAILAEYIRAILSTKEEPEEKPVMTMPLEKEDEMALPMEELEEPAGQDEAIDDAEQPMGMEPAKTEQAPPQLKISPILPREAPDAPELLATDMEDSDAQPDIEPMDDFEDLFTTESDEMIEDDDPSPTDDLFDVGEASEKMETTPQVDEDEPVMWDEEEAAADDPVPAEVMGSDPMDENDDAFFDDLDAPIGR